MSIPPRHAIATRDTLVGLALHAEMLHGGSDGEGSSPSSEKSGVTGKRTR